MEIKTTEQIEDTNNIKGVRWIRVDDIKERLLNDREDTPDNKLRHKISKIIYEL